MTNPIENNTSWQHPPPEAYDGSWTRPLHEGPDPVRFKDQAQYHQELAEKYAREGNVALARSMRSVAEHHRKAHTARTASVANDQAAEQEAER